MKIFLDDERPTPDNGKGWTRAYSVNEAIEYIEFSISIGLPFEEASLDHDLGDYYPDGGDGVKLVDWMAENAIWPLNGITIHSGNPVGRKNMLLTIDRYGPYSRDYRHNKRGNV